MFLDLFLVKYKQIYILFSVLVKNIHKLVSFLYFRIIKKAREPPLACNQKNTYEVFDFSSKTIQN